jgi:hypothetical protein
MVWRLPDGYAPAAAPVRGFRLGELVLVPDGPVPLRWERLAARVTRAGYVPLEAAPGWLQFRPRSTWLQGVARHARLRDQRLHLRLDDDGGWLRAHFAGLLTAGLERDLARLGTLYRLRVS